MKYNSIVIIRGTYSALLSPVCLTIWIVATVVAIAAGPFGTFSALTFLERLAYWGVISITSIILGYMGVALANMLWHEDRAITRHLAGAVFADLIITTNVWLLSQMPVWGDGPRPGFGILLSYIVLITAAASLVKYLANAALKSSAAEQAAVQDTKAPPRLFRRIPEVVGQTLVHLSVQDHFVEVTTCSSTVSVRMRFRDALDELDGVEGYRVHRSHWVAKHAVDQVIAEQSRVFLELVNGTRVPVSRGYRPVLEDAGLI